MIGRSLTLFALSALALPSLLAGCEGGAERDAAGRPPYIRAHSLQQLMATVMEPDAQVFWRSSGAVSDSGGTRDLTPTTPEGWAAARSAAATVAETGNLLMTPVYGEDRGPDWIAFSQELVRAGRQAELAAMSRDGDAMFEAGGKLSEACSACHQAYLPQEQAARADSAR
jgi:hypothetical protein